MIEIDFFAKINIDRYRHFMQKLLNIKRKVGKYEKASTLKNNTKTKLRNKS